MKILENALRNAPDAFTFELIKMYDNAIVKSKYKVAIYLLLSVVISTFMCIQYYYPVYIFNIKLTWLYLTVFIALLVLLRYAWINYRLNIAIRKGLNNAIYGLELT